MILLDEWSNLQQDQRNELLNNIFAANAQLDDGGKSPPNILCEKTSAVLSNPEVLAKRCFEETSQS
jgi:hypothetical protein